MLEVLFSSITRVEVLKLFLFNPDNSFYQRQISHLTNHPIRGVQREVEKLEKIGLIEKSIEGNRRYYRINKNCPIFEPLRLLFLKSEGCADALRAALEEGKNILIAFIYGSYAESGETRSSDIDLMVIGDISAKELSGILSNPKRELGREINYVVFTIREFRARIKSQDHFLGSVLGGKKIFVIGNNNELKSVAKSAQDKTPSNIQI